MFACECVYICACVCVCVFACASVYVCLFVRVCVLARVFVLPFPRRSWPAGVFVLFARFCVRARVRAPLHSQELAGGRLRLFARDPFRAPMAGSLAVGAL